MENNSDFIKRLEDLAQRCDRSGSIACTNFLTPAERWQAEHWGAHREDFTLLFHGGDGECERTVAFFLPSFLDERELDPAEYISAIKLTAHFGEPGHRDYMGALLGMGIGREWLGDIRVMGHTAYVFCRTGVLRHLLSIDKVGRCGVKTEAMELSAVPKPEKQVKPVSFSVMSMRLDAVVGGMFSLSRTEAARQIGFGNVSVNYSQTERTDLAVHEGDIISLRGAGKGTVTGTGGTSRKGRLFVYADIYR